MCSVRVFNFFFEKHSPECSGERESVSKFVEAQEVLFAFWLPHFFEIKSLLIPKLKIYLKANSEKFETLSVSLFGKLATLFYIES